MEINLDINDCSVVINDGLATAQIVVPSEDVEWYLNKTLRINLEDGNYFTGIITAINDYGNNNASAVLTAKSIVNMAMDLQFYNESSTFFYGINEPIRSYKGTIFATANCDTGEYEKTRINYFLKLLVNNASEQARSLWNEKIEYSTTGKQNSKLLEGFQWNGDTISNLFFNILGSTFDITTRIDGNKIQIRNIDKGAVDRVIDEDEIQDLMIGVDLMASASSIEIESPDINSYSKAVTLDLTRKLYGLPQQITDKAGTNVFDVGTGTSPNREYFNIEKNVFEYDIPHDSGTFKLTVDTRYTAKTTWKGEAYEKFGWKRKIAVVDENLGRAGNSDDSELTQIYDRTEQQNILADYYARVMGDLEYQGSLSLPYDYRISVGDVCRLPDGKIIIIKSIKYSFTAARKIVSFGNNEGNAYNELKNRVRLPEVIAKQEEIEGTPQPMVLVQKDNGQGTTWMSFATWRTIMNDPFNAPRWRIIMAGVDGKPNARRPHTRSDAFKELHAKKDTEKHAKDVQKYNRSVRKRGGTNFIKDESIKKPKK